MNSTNGDITPCLSDFYTIAYSGKFNCTQNYDFFSSNLTVSHNAFKNGKTCVLEIAKANCHPAQYKFISEKYDDFLSVLTTKPETNSSCTEEFYYKYNGMKCSPMILEIMSKSLMIGTDEVLEMNDPRLLAIIDMCHSTLECIEPQCFIEKVTKGALRSCCASAERRNTGFWICRDKLAKQSPDLSPFKCLHGVDFFTADESVQIELLTNNAPCVKEVMKRLCGEEYVTNFQEEADIAISWLQDIVELKKLTKEE